MTQDSSRLRLGVLGMFVLSLFCALLARLGERLAGRVTVLVTHRPAEAATADLVIEVRDGTARVSGSVAVRA